MTFIAFFANHHTDCFFLPSSGPHCWPPTLSSLFNLSSQFWPEWESQLPSNGSFFPSHEMNSRPGPAAPPAPSFCPLPTVGDPFLYPFANSPLPNGEPQADAPPSHSHRAAASQSCICPRVGREPVNRCSVALFHSQQRHPLSPGWMVEYRK